MRNSELLKIPGLLVAKTIVPGPGQKSAQPTRFLTFARTSIEKGIAEAWQEANHGAVLEGNLQQQEFIFRYFIVPQFAATTIREKSQGKSVPWWLFEHGCLILALERTLLELEASLGMISSEASLSKVNVSIYPTIKRLAFGDSVGAFDSAKWMSRFEIHQQTCKESLKLAGRFYSADCCDSDTSSVRASFYGLIENKTPFPGSLREIVLNQAASTNEKKKFYKNAADPKAGELSTMPSLDHWLIEAWPIVTANSWGYEDILSLARKKFPKYETLTSKEQMRERCRKLKLSGMPRGTVRLTIKPPYSSEVRIALFIADLHSQRLGEWLKGQRGLISKNIKWG